MAIEITFELSDADLEHFREIMTSTVKKAEQMSEQDIIASAQQLCADMENASLPDFVSSRMVALKELIDAVQDAEWQMPDDEKQDILTSLAYFNEPHDLVPDHVPVLGYVDDAIMIDLVMQDMSLDLTAYREFCSFRATEESRRGDAAQVDRESWLEGTRSQIRSNMRRKRKEGRGRRLFMMKR